MILQRLALVGLALFLVGCGTIEFGFEPTAGAGATVVGVNGNPTVTGVAGASPTSTRSATAPASTTDVPTEGAALASATTSPTAVTCTAQHVVKTDETLMSIGQAYGADWREIAAANALSSPGLIVVGQRLCIPNAVRTPGAPTTRPTLTATATASLTPTLTATDVLTPTVSSTPTATTTACGLDWFFAPPAPVDCPEGAAQTSSAATERFERGQMVWISTLDSYYILLNAGVVPGESRPAYIQLQGLPLKPGADVDNRVGETPQPGLLEPVSGFGHIWRDEVLGDFSLLGGQRMRDAIGWAVELEYAFTTTIQCGVSQADSVRTCYLQMPRQRVLAVESGASSRIWRYEIGP